MDDNFGQAYLDECDDWRTRYQNAMDDLNSKTVRVGWYCSMFVGAPKWQGTEIYEPDECDTYFETDVDEDEWKEGSASARCPKCHSILWQSDDSAELIEEENGNPGTETIEPSNSSTQTGGSEGSDRKNV